jgi:trimethylamine--corrinoid protein Co-methyltransferase
LIELERPPIELFTIDQLEEIHLASLEVLQRTGVIFRHPDALRAFEDAGATVDRRGERVFIPGDLVEDQVKKAPSLFTWHARDPKKSMKFEGSRMHFGPVCSPSFVYDLENGQRRDATLKDFENIVKLMDYLERVDEGYGSVHPQDVPEWAVHAHVILAQVRNTAKCVRGRCRGRTVSRDCLRMISMVAGGE